MELTGGAASRAMGGDEKSGCMGEEVGSGCSVRVERWVRPEPFASYEERPYLSTTQTPEIASSAEMQRSHGASRTEGAKG